MPQPNLVELQSLRAQINALAQVTLRAVAVLEMNGLVHGPTLEGALREIVWPEPINEDARCVTAELCQLLSAAREQRQAVSQ